jgi:hypothetical protein
MQEHRMSSKDQAQNKESGERQKQGQGTEHYGSGPGSSGPGPVRVHSHTPENKSGELNPSAPNDATEGPSTNLGKNAPTPATRGAAAQEEGDKKREGTIKKPSAEKHEAA